MLMIVLKGELAVKQSKALIRTFKKMKDYIVENQGLIGKREFLQLKYGFLLLNGQPIEANLAYKDIYSIAKKSIYIVDNYIGVKNLVLLKYVPSSVEIIIFSDNIGKGLHTLEYKDFCREYPFRKITFQKSGGEFNDRYIIIEWNTEHQRIYHCGASSKDAGQRITSIMEVVDQMIYTDLINNLLKNPVLKLK